MLALVPVLFLKPLEIISIAQEIDFGEMSWRKTGSTCNHVAKVWLSAKVYIDKETNQFIYSDLGKNELESFVEFSQ